MHARPKRPGILAAVAGVDDDDLASVDRQAGDRGQLRALGGGRRCGRGPAGGQVDDIAVGRHAVGGRQEEAAHHRRGPGQGNLQSGRVAVRVDAPGAHKPLPVPGHGGRDIQALELEPEAQRAPIRQALALGGAVQLYDDAGLALVSAEADLDDRGRRRVPGGRAQARQGCADSQQPSEPEAETSRRSPAHVRPMD